MNSYRSNAAFRLFYLFAASMIWLGILLTGFAESSWVFYVPGITFAIAAITGYCPSLIVIRKALNQ